MTTIETEDDGCASSDSEGLFHITRHIRSNRRPAIRDIRDSSCKHKEELVAVTTTTTATTTMHPTDSFRDSTEKTG